MPLPHKSLSVVQLELLLLAEQLSAALGTMPLADFFPDSLRTAGNTPHQSIPVSVGNPLPESGSQSLLPSAR